MFGKETKNFIEISIDQSETICSEQYPLFVTIKNKSVEDITNVDFLAYAYDSDYSRAECAEHYDLESRIIRSGETYTACWNTLDSRGFYYNGRSISDEMANDSISMDGATFFTKYGDKAEILELSKARSYLNKLARKHRDLTRSVNPKQWYGCRHISDDMPWAGTVRNMDIFSGY